MEGLRKPYLLFLGDAPDQLAAKTAHGVADWRPDWCVGQLRFPDCQADVGLDDVSIEEAARRGAKTLLIGIVNSGGFLPDSWTESITEAIAAGMDVASGLHSRLEDFPAVAEAAAAHDRQLFNIRHTDREFSTGKGERRSGKRLLTVGTDANLGKKYTALSIERELRQRGIKADFRATGQTGILIAERGVAIDAVVADFISGAAEWISPENEPDHWDCIEGQGSLFHASYAGVTLGLIHGSQPDALVLCHEPTRTHMRGLPHAPLPEIEECLQLYVACGRLTNPDCRFAGISVNTAALDAAEAERYLKSLRQAHALPVTDPIRFGVAAIVDELV
ncbi:MAG: DUF1611 domain-containing protein [Alphaproteobacteria bacterium]|jgi:uncharacterized NAD-dependent epimerase/dehydratase family protein|nr:DUF1611 domain-containing protein [Alphaproteobacteria bacterium]